MLALERGKRHLAEERRVVYEGKHADELPGRLVAAREAEAMRAAAAAAPAIGEDGEVLGGATDEELEKDENANASEEEVAASQASPRSAMPSSPNGWRSRDAADRGLGDDVLDRADLVDEEPAVEEDEVDEGYVLEEEDEELEKKRTRVSGRLGAATRTTKGPIDSKRRSTSNARILLNK